MISMIFVTSVTARYEFITSYYREALMYQQLLLVGMPGRLHGKGVPTAIPIQSCLQHQLTHGSMSDVSR